MSTPFWIKKMLTKRGIAFEELHHPEVFTAQELAEREHFTGYRVAKVVVVMADGIPVELILPATHRVSMGRVRRMLNARKVRLATEQEMAQFFTDCEVGAIPPLRHWEEVEVFMDESLDVAGDIIFQAGTHEDAVRLCFDDWYQLVQPQVESFSVPTEAVYS